MISRSTVFKGFVVLVVLGLVAGAAVAGIGALTLEQPRVQSVDNEWGNVDEESTEIETTVVVNNPNPIGVPGVATVHYTATMNDVVIAEGTEENVGLSPGRNTIQVTAEMRNERVAEWWVSHINNDERSELTITATVSGPFGFQREVPVESATFETDLLGNMETTEARTIELRGEPFIVLKGQQASWGEATEEEIPVTFSATVENRHEYPLTLDGIGYTIRMNNVTVGAGETTEGVEIKPGETGTIGATAAIDTGKLADWWASHVRKNETTVLSVEMYGIVERDGERRRIPLSIFEEKVRFRTEMLSGGGTTVESLPTGDDAPTFQNPEITGVDREWGQVTSSTTEVRTTIHVDNPNQGRLNDFITVELGQSITINGVVVAAGESDLGGLEAGNDSVQATAHMDNSKVPEWWARHVNNGEQSTMVVQPEATADLGFTKFDVPVAEKRRTVGTDLLADLNSDADQTVTVRGRDVAVITKTRASWGQATDQRTPIVVEATIENTGSAPITIQSIDYRVAMNDVVVGEDVATNSYTIQPGETTTVTYTIVLDSQKMDEWWVSHVRNDETTTMDVDVTATVSSGGNTAEVPVDSLTGNSTVETDFLGQT